MLPDFEALGIIPIFLNMTKQPLSFFRTIKSLINYIDQHNIFIIHAHMPHAGLMALAIRMFRPKVRVVFTPHNVDMESHAREIILYIGRFLRTKDIVFSRAKPRYFVKGQPAYIPNGIDVKQYLGANQQRETFTFAVIGRLEPQKNHHGMIDAARKIKDRAFRILIIGAGNLEAELRHKVASLDLQEKIIFCGIRRDIPKVLNSIDCLLIPSLWEGLPIVMLEAGAAGTPIIANPVGDIPSILDHSNATLASPEEFHIAMEEAMDDLGTARKKAKLFQGLVQEKFSLEQTVKRHEQLYSSQIS